MPKQRVVTLDGGSDGSTYTSIRATIPCHTLRVYEDGSRTTQFKYKRKEDGFVQEFTSDQGDILEFKGAGQHGILGKPPNYAGIDAPPEVAASAGDSGGGDVILMIKASATSTPDLVVYEDEKPDA